MNMTLEDYFRYEFESDPKLPKIDFVLRINPTDKGVDFYIHPANRDGNTTPSLTLVGNNVKWPV